MWWCSFKSEAHHLLIRLEGYLKMLNQHGISWEKVESEDPGQIVYEDDVQIVVAVNIPEYYAQS